MPLTTAGSKCISEALLGQATLFDAQNAFIGVGNSSAAFSSSQTDLVGTSVFRKGMDAGYPKIDNGQVTYRATFALTEANFAWNEWGVFNAASAGTMLVRVLEANGTKLNTQTWILEVTVAFTS